MEEQKKWYQSQTIIAAVVVVVATVAGFFGYTIDLETQAGIVDAILALITAIGGVVAIYGRVKANRIIK